MPVTVKDSSAFTSVPSSSVSFANRDLRSFSITELALIAIVLILFFKFVIIDAFWHHKI